MAKNILLTLISSLPNTVEPTPNRKIQERDKSRRCLFSVGMQPLIRIPIYFVSSYLFSFPFEACQTQAVNLANSNIHSDKRFTASSFLANNEPYKARLRNTLGAWLPSSNNNTNDYLEVELGDVFFICAVATQGHPLDDQGTISFKLHLFLRNWITYKENNSEKVWQAVKPL